MIHEVKCVAVSPFLSWNSSAFQTLSMKQHLLLLQIFFCLLLAGCGKSEEILLPPNPITPTVASPDSVVIYRGRSNYSALFEITYSATSLIQARSEPAGKRTDAKSLVAARGSSMKRCAARMPHLHDPTYSARSRFSFVRVEPFGFLKERLCRLIGDAV